MPISPPQSTVLLISTAPHILKQGDKMTPKGQMGHMYFSASCPLFVCTLFVSESAYWSVCVWRGIQFLVLADQVVVHLFISCFEVVHIGLIRGGAGQLHVGTRPKWPHVEATFAVKIKAQAHVNTRWLHNVGVTAQIPEHVNVMARQKRVYNLNVLKKT